MSSAPLAQPHGLPREAAATAAPSRSPYLVGAVYDWAFFLLSPALSLVLGILISGSDFTERSLGFGRSDTAAGLFIGTMIHAHLVAVFVRSHANPTIFRLHPIRFVVVPIVLWVAIASSTWLAIAATVVATFWDVWHSGAQTFGFARIYDRNHGVPPEMGRRLDFWLNQLLYAGPILAGATLMDHVDSFEKFKHVGSVFFTSIPARVEGVRQHITAAILVAGTLFLVYYVAAYWRLYRRGYRFSFEKVFLLVSTGFCSIYTWGFNTWGEAFFIMNLFHAVQYLALVWATEHGRVMDLLRVSRRRGGKPIAALAFFGAILLYGFGVQVLNPGITVLWAATIVVSLMHFWYDAFIWSVRKRQV